MPSWFTTARTQRDARRVKESTKTGICRICFKEDEIIPLVGMCFSCNRKEGKIRDATLKELYRNHVKRREQGASMQVPPGVPRCKECLVPKHPIGLNIGGICNPCQQLRNAITLAADQVIAAYRQKKFRMAGRV